MFQHQNLSCKPFSQFSVHRVAPKLLWSVDGRSPEKSLAADCEGIEVGAEAHEELQLLEEVPSTAAALAKAICAGLRK